MIAVVHNIVTDPCWSSINLPHIKKFEEINLHKWLYYKKFDWISIDNQIQQQIQLVFGPNINLNDSSVSSNITATIWLNNTKIFSGSFMSLTNPIELPSKLLHNENILVICCSNSILSRHARLILHGKIICATGQVNVSEEFSSR
ncbi:unnamed protein product, partial [Adineta steineri]